MSWGVVAAVGLLGLSLAQESAPLFDPVQGYRLTHYRGVVPAPPDGVPRVDGATVRALWRTHRAVFVDASPAAGVRDAATGRWTLYDAHRTIPGAHWFPDSGRGMLADEVARWLTQGVRRLQASRPGRPVVVFCYADCWMSWNVALRLHRAGIRDVRWFAEGLDGWHDMDLPTVEAVAASWSVIPTASKRR